MLANPILAGPYFHGYEGLIGSEGGRDRVKVCPAGGQAGVAWRWQ